MASVTDKGAESIHAPDYYEFQVPRDVAELEQYRGIDAAVGGEAPDERLLALSGLCVEVIRVSQIAGGRAVVNTQEVIQALRDERRYEEAAWWEGFRQRGVHRHTSENATGWLFFPNTWLHQLGADASSAE